MSTIAQELIYFRSQGGGGGGEGLIYLPPPRQGKPVMEVIITEEWHSRMDREKPADFLPKTDF